MTADNVAWVPGRGHVVEEYTEGVFGCGRLWKRMLGEERVGLPSLYTARRTGG